MRFSAKERFMRLPAIVCVVLCLTGLAGIAGAAVTTLNFEGVPTDHYFYVGNMNLGNHYDGQPNGPVFGADATILDKIIGGYNDFNYPPHSGNAVLFSDLDSTIRVDFTTPVSSVGLWYTANSMQSPFGLFLDAYNSADTLLASAFGGNNLGTNSPLGIVWGSDVIDYVKIHDGGDRYTIDDFWYDSTGTPIIPEPSTFIIWSVLAAGGIGLTYWRRKRAA
jgi:hypothetical protein